MAKRYTLRRGDICPCCGQTIRTGDEELLVALSVIAHMLKDYEWPEEGNDE